MEQKNSGISPPPMYWEEWAKFKKENKNSSSNHSLKSFYSKRNSTDRSNPLRLNKYKKDSNAHSQSKYLVVTF